MWRSFANEQQKYYFVKHISVKKNNARSTPTSSKIGSYIDPNCNAKSGMTKPGEGAHEPKCWGWVAMLPHIPSACPLT